MLDNVLYVLSMTAQAILWIALGLVALYAASWAVGSGWRRGTSPTPPRPPQRPHGANLPSPRKASRSLARQGGICGHGHYVPSDRPTCSAGHEWSVQATLDAGSAAVERARQRHEMEATRVASGWA